MLDPVSLPGNPPQAQGSSTLPAGFLHASYGRQG